jgi:sugar transferase (PEP-CTERM/EpsH1 system associated)
LQILFLAHRVPYPPNRGDRIRSFHLLKHLAERAEVSLGYLADREPEGETSRVLAGMCRRVAAGRLGRSRWLHAAGSLAAGRTATVGLFRCGELRRTIAQWASETRFDTVVVFCSSMTQYLDVPGLIGVPVVVDLVDVDSEKWFDYARETHTPARMLFQLEGRRLRRLEASLAERTQAITLVSEAEANVYRGFQPAGSVYAIPNGVDLDYFRPSPEPEPPGMPRCVFVGALDYRANVDGLAWFCREVWPAVHEHVPGTVLQIVGSNPGPAARRLANSAGVDLAGPVPDVRPYLAGAVAVVPLRVARGIQNKVLEAMAMARPVIASPEALEGLTVEPGRDVLCAAAPGDWRDQLVRLLNDATQRVQLGIAARRYVETHHQWPKCLERFGQIVLGEEGVRCQVSGVRGELEH